MAAATAVSNAFAAYIKLSKEERGQFDAMILGWNAAKSNQADAGKKANATRKAGPKAEPAAA